MNLLDLVILLFGLGAATTGFRLGLAARAVSWGGGLVGLGASALLVPWGLNRWTGGDTVTRLAVGLAVVLVVTSIGSGIGEVIGLRLQRRVHATPLRSIDRLAGGIAGALSVLLLLWFMLPAMSSTPGAVARQVRGSTIIALIIDVAPDPPDAARALQRVIDQSGFPQVFANLQPAPITGPPPDQVPVPAEVVQASTASTVNIEAFGCGSGFEGSGFVADEGLVVTNAHVVAGADDIRLRRPDGSTVPATVRTLDSDRDLAVLEAPLGGALPRRAATVGEGGAVIGYPGGQDTPRVAPATVRDDRPTVGRDLYGRSLVERRVLYLAANLQQGDSGSAIIGADGAVIGVVFAVSPDDPNVAYALHNDEVEAVLAAEPNRTSGACL